MRMERIVNVMETTTRASGKMMRINDGVSANVGIAGIGRTEGASPGKVIVYCGCRVRCVTHCADQWISFWP